jgi:hypothetical protein
MDRLLNYGKLSHLQAGWRVNNLLRLRGDQGDRVPAVVPSHGKVDLQANDYNRNAMTTDFI